MAENGGPASKRPKLNEQEEKKIDGTFLRILAVNDVYLLSGLARVKTLVLREKERLGNDNVIVTLAGDFLGPTLLSSLDYGAGMVACLNRVPVDVVCFGNHESDIPFDSLKQRIKQFQGVWLNSNMDGFAVPLPRYWIKEVKPKEGGAPRKVGFLGLLIGGTKHFNSMYSPDAFGGALDSIKPILEAAPEAAALLRRDHPDVNCIIPITHQDLREDIILAETGQYPIILAGHDHAVTIQKYGPKHVYVVKGGMDAQHCAIVDLHWPANAPPDAKPHVNVELLALDQIDPEPELAAFCEESAAPERALKFARLYTATPAAPLSSKNIRTAEGSVPKLLCTAIKVTMRCDTCLIPAGCIRANRDYPDIFTQGDLAAEMPFPDPFVVVRLPGRVLQETVQESRAPWLQGQENGLALHVDKDTIVDPATNLITSVAGAPIDLDRMYAVALSTFTLSAFEPIIAYTKQHPDIVPPADSGRPPVAAVVEYLCRELWRKLLDRDGDGHVTESELIHFLNSVDKDKTGKLDVAEIRAAVTERLGDHGELVSWQLINLLDINRDGQIDLKELRGAMQ